MTGAASVGHFPGATYKIHSGRPGRQLRLGILHISPKIATCHSISLGGIPSTHRSLLELLTKCSAADPAEEHRCWVKLADRK